ncbi:uncharacterized protein LOC109370582 isoform X3 [Meleagris gallopavo]|uniref:uncharacterized protein LOC109370582 isoform X3 n=1 Tax=Meleagris gallopavo TaxID=9103 RepID=UPI0012ABC766|nr:uncharacterized protein LOC109370582 isoform X3 [Meleagris gallopavo]
MKLSIQKKEALNIHRMAVGSSRADVSMEVRLQDEVLGLPSKQKPRDKPPSASPPGVRASGSRFALLRAGLTAGSSAASVFSIWQPDKKSVLVLLAFLFLWKTNFCLRDLFVLVSHGVHQRL